MSGEELGNLMVKGWYSGIWEGIKLLWPHFLIFLVIVILINILDKKVKASIAKKKEGKRKNKETTSNKKER